MLLSMQAVDSMAVSGSMLLRTYPPMPKRVKKATMQKNVKTVEAVEGSMSLFPIFDGLIPCILEPDGSSKKYRKNCARMSA